MKIRASGDAKRIQDWQKALESSDKLLTAMSQNMAEEVISLIGDGFRKQADPYGKRWKAKKYPDGRNVLVGKTARLRNGWHVTKTSRGGFSVSPSVDYAVHHQFGAPRAKIPPRMMVPGKGRLPQSWRDALNETAQELMAAHFGGTRRPPSRGAGFVTAKIGGLKRRFNAAALLRKLMKKVAGE